MGIGSKVQPVTAGKGNGKPGRAPEVSDDDLALWKHVTRETEPLKKRGAPKRGMAPERPVPEAKARDQVPGKAKRAAIRPAASAPAKPAAPELDHGRVAGVDRRSAGRMKRGRLPVEATLDLHGHTQDEAHAALGAFLAAAEARALRCVLVITGKGLTKVTGGVLRNQVPRWLNEPANRARILAFDYAQPRHGGLGALYVLMRRKR